MFNHPDPNRLAMPPISDDILHVAVINRQGIALTFEPKPNNIIVNEITQFVCVKIPEYEQICRPLVIEQLESAFCTVILASFEDSIIETLSIINDLLHDSNKWPHIILLTPEKLCLNTLETMPELNQMIKKHIEFPLILDLDSLNKLVSNKLYAVIGDLHAERQYAAPGIASSMKMC